MARPVSSLESHPQRGKIIQELVADTPYRQISAWTDPPVTIATLSRYKSRAIAVTREAVIAAKRAIANSDNGLDAVATQAVTRAALTAAADPFVGRILKHQATLDAEITSAKGDARGIAALIGTDLKGLELHARLERRLDGPTSQTSIMIVCPAGAPEPAVTLEPDAVVIDIGQKR